MRGYGLWLLRWGYETLGVKYPTSSKGPMIKIMVGSCGPTDCCLIVTDGSKSREFLIESAGWRILSTLLCFIGGDPCTLCPNSMAEQIAYEVLENSEFEGGVRHGRAK